MRHGSADQYYRTFARREANTLWFAGGIVLVRITYGLQVIFHHRPFYCHLFGGSNSGTRCQLFPFGDAETGGVDGAGVTPRLT
jgi:hypothetical protein